MGETVDNGRGETLYITFGSEDDILHFVDTCNKYDDAVDVVWHKLHIDAKSVLGMLQLPMNEALPIKYGCFDDEDNYNAFREDVISHYNISVQSRAVS